VNDVYILDAVRAKLGRYAGALSTTRPDDLAAAAAGELLRRSRDLEPDERGAPRWRGS
jgi:acetyl-CoA acetyltransferase